MMNRISPFAILLIMSGIAFPSYAEEPAKATVDPPPASSTKAEETPASEESKSTKSAQSSAKDEKEAAEPEKEAKGAKPPVEDKAAESEKEPDEIKNFVIEHRIGDVALPAETVPADPMVLFQTLKNTIVTQSAKQTKPFTLETLVKAVWAEAYAKSWSQFPPLTITTQIDKEGKGKSAFKLPEFKQTVAEGEEKTLVNWKGLQGQLSFTEKFDSPRIDVTTDGLTIKEEGGNNFTLSLDKTAFKGEFDTDLLPTALNLNLPLLRVEDKTVQLNVQGVTFDGKTRVSEQGIELNGVNFKANQLHFSENNVKSTLNEFELTGDGEIKTDGVFYKINTKIGKIIIPKKFVDDKADIELSYVGNLELRRLDINAVKQLQQTARKLQKQRQSGEIEAEMVNITWLAKLTELAPALLARSPEIALTQLNFSTNDGKLDGKTTVSIDGKKASSLEDFTNIVAALQVQAEFNVTKILLEKLMTAALTGEQKEGAKTSPEDLHKQAAAAAKTQIKGLVEQKFLLEEGSDYKLKATFKEGKLMVNGQEMPSPF